MGAAHVVVQAGIGYAPGIDPAISRGLSGCPTAGPTATASASFNGICNQQ